MVAPAIDAPPASAATRRSAQPLLSVQWIDVSDLPMEPGEATTAEQTLGDLLAEQMITVYRDQVETLIEYHPDAASPLDLEAEMAIRQQALGLADGRLTQYEQRLKEFLATSPDEDALVDWLADRATQDAANWARLDALEIRHDATEAFYMHNRPAPDQRFTIQPSSAAEWRCQSIAGETFDTYAQASDALDWASHRGCVHYVEPA